MVTSIVGATPNDYSNDLPPSLVTENSLLDERGEFKHKSLCMHYKNVCKCAIIAMLKGIDIMAQATISALDSGKGTPHELIEGEHL